MKKRILSVIMICLLIFGMVITPSAIEADAASTYTINGVSVRYDNFASSPNECWVYANNIYNKIWGQKFNNQFGDSNNSLRNLSDSQLTLTKEHLKAYVTNAKLGSVLRICDSQYLHGSDGWGHSQIIVQKDSNGFTVFEGGLSASPYCREKYFTWDAYMSSSYLGAQYEYIKYIKWPNAPAYSSSHTYTKGEYKYYWDAHPHYKCYQCTMCDEIKEDKSETVKLEGCEQCYPTKATITFNANGGTCSTSSKKIDIGGKIGTLPTPTRDGYIFVGWSSSPKSNYHIVDSTFTYDKDTTLYAHWTSGVYDGIKLDFDANGGTLPTYVAACGVDGFNVPRDTHELIVYNCDGEYVATNYYGYEIAVNANGVVTAKRNYGDNTQLQVPVGGFVVSANGTTSNETAKFVHDIAVGMYVGYDEGSAKIYSYSSNNAYLVNHRYMDVNDTYSYLPRPSRDGYLFDGWLDPWNGNAGYFDIYEACSLHASWTPEDEAIPYASYEYNGHVYELYDYIMSWEEAEAFCKERGGTLATITDSNEQALIEELVVVGNRGQYYIGATDANSEGNWEWVTGESFSYNNWDARAGEPNGGTSANWATVMGRDNAPNKTVGEWNDVVSCDDGSTFYNATNTGFILEREAAGSDEIEPLVLNIDIGDPSDSYITLYWNSIGKRDSGIYEIYREVNSSGNYELFATLEDLDTLGLSDHTIDPGNRYRYFVRAFTTDGEIIDSNIKGIKYNIDPPVLSAKDVGEGKATLTWNAVEGADHYIVYIDMPWNDPPTNGFEGFIRTTGTSAEVIANLDEIYYKVEAVGYDASITAYSNEVAVQCALPTPQIDIGIDTGNKKPLISWNPIWGTRTFQVQRATSATGSFTSIHTTDINNVYVDETAKAGNTYYYRVRAVVLDDYGAIKYESYSAVKETTVHSCADGHNYQAIITPPDCLEDGYTTYTCSRCGNSYKSDYTGTTDHNFVPTVVPPTCTEAGFTTYTCSMCGGSYDDDFVDATGHNYVNNKCISCGDLKVTLSTPVVKAGKVDDEGFITITWQPVDGAEKYIISRSCPWAEDGDDWEEDFDSTTKTYYKIKATAGYTNYYYVTAAASSGKSDSSKGISSYCALAVPVASAKTDTDSGNPVISWEKTWQNPIYVVLRARSKNGQYYVVGDNYLNDFSFDKKTDKYIFEDENTTAGQTYYYKVAVATETHEDYVIEKYSEICSAACKLARPVVKISNISSSGKIKLTWNKVDGAKEYKIYRSTSKSGSYSLMKTTTSTSYTNTTAKAGTLYYYKVRAIGKTSAANSSYSEIKSRTCDLARTTVTLSNVATSGKIKVSWTKVSGAAKYKVYRATSEDGTYTLKKTTTSRTWTDTNASVGKKYYYKVVAVHKKSAANSADSLIKSKVCDLKSPTVSITRSSGKPKVSWTAVSGATKYKIYRSTSKTGTYKLVKTTTSKSWKDTTAKKGKTYYYKVVAVHKNSSANSAYSSYKSIKCTK